MTSRAGAGREDYLFVYGTLRRCLGHPMHRVLRRHARPAGRARFPGRLYDLGPYPAAVPTPGRREWVAGELYRVTDPHGLFPALDAFEGCSPARPRGGEYRRERRTVYPERGPAVRAWIYLYNPDPRGHRRIVSGDYLQRTGSS